MKFIRTWLLSVAAAVAAVFGAGVALAAEGGKKTPYLEIVVPIEIQNDWHYKSDERGSELNDLFATIEPQVTIGLLPGLSVFAHGVLEPMRGPAFRENRTFEDHGLFLEDLYLQYAGQLVKHDPNSLGFRIWGGKFTPNFGIAWDAAPGVFGTDFVEDYELNERIGFGGALALNHGALGEHTLSASTFFLDTSALGGSVLSNRPRNRRADGGPSNTGRLSSFHVALDGERIPGLEGLRYHVAFVHQGLRGPIDENGFAAALAHEFEGDGITFVPLIEIAHFWDADGVAGQRRSFLTTAINMEHKGWSLSLSHTLRDTHVPGAGRIRDNLIHVSGGHRFENGIGIEIGWSQRNEESTETHTIGVLITYEFSFEIGKSARN